jgi:DUF1365 family protein
MLTKPALFSGQVYHARHKPFFHDFNYRVFTLWIDVDDFDNAAQTPRFFSFNKCNLLSLHKKDHGPRDGTNIRPWIESAARKKNIDMQDGKIFMLTFPRVFGYGFSPLTVYFLYNKTGKLIALLHQVKNTFGGQHGYLLAVEDDANIQHSAEKVFHVSPFIDMDCFYNFTVSEPSKTGFSVKIHQTQDDEKMLTAIWTGEKKYEFKTRHILKLSLLVPFQSFKVISAIHWQALKLWLKGAKYRPEPARPREEVS